MAPSPTGQVHLGTARTAIVAYLAARAAGGTLVMRMEDLDGPRVVAGAAEAIMADLRWLGIDWDEGPDVGGAYGPYLQSQRFGLYAQAVEQLKRAGHVFACSCSRREVVEAASAPHPGADGDLGPQYPGTCRTGPLHPERPLSQRFRMLKSEAFNDRVYGEYERAACDDFVVQRADGCFAYQLAVVVDDIAMGITEVVRGADLLSSTPRQLALYRALGAAPPRFLHVPLVLGGDGVRLAKRHGALPIAELRARGWDASRVVGWLAHSLGIIPTMEPVMLRELVPHFDAAKLPRAPTVLEPSTLGL